MKAEPYTRQQIKDAIYNEIMESYGTIKGDKNPYYLVIGIVTAALDKLDETYG